MEKIKILFLCVHNSARSQIAEAYMKKFGSDKFDAVSAGLEPGRLNPIAIKVMLEDGIDISKNTTKDVFTLYKDGYIFNYVVTVCDVKNSQLCPVFPGLHKKISWDFEDPSSLAGTDEDKLEQTRKIRDQIKLSVKNLINEIG